MPLTPFDPPTGPAPSAPAPFDPSTVVENAPVAPARGIITAATGGGSQALDGQLVSLWRLGEAVFVVGETVSLWQLQTSTQATDANAGFVRPADFHATLNPRVFVRLVLSGVGSGGGGGGGGAVSSVAGRTGAVVLVKADVGLGNVDDTSDLAKPVSTAQAAALATKANAASLGAHTSDTANPHAVTKAQVGLANVTNDAQVKRVEMGAASGVATLGADGKLTAAQLPSIAVVDYLGRVASQSAMLAKSAAEQGDWLIRNDTGTVWIMTGSNPASLSSWTALEYPVAPVTSVAGRTGDVVLVKADVGLGNVDNTADAAKPVSTAQAAAIGAKADVSALTAHTGRTDNPHSVTKAQVGLGSVDNTSDAAKPVSTAQAAAIAAKLDASQRGAANGVAPLDASSKVPAANMPDEIDGVIQIRSGVDTDVGTVVLARNATLAAREIAWDETRKGLRIGDGVTPGGELLDGLPVPRAVDTVAWDAIKAASGSAPRVVAAMHPTLGFVILRLPTETGATGSIGLGSTSLRISTPGGDFYINKGHIDSLNSLAFPSLFSVALNSGDMLPLQYGFITVERLATIIFSHTATLGSLTVTLPTEAVRGFELRLFFVGAVTALTVSPSGSATLLAGSNALPTAATANMEVLLMPAEYGAATSSGKYTVNKWLRIR